MRTSVLLTLALAVAALQARAGAPSLWFERGVVTPQATELLHAMRAAEEHGLHPADYAIELDPDEIDGVLAGRADERTRLDFDAALSRAAARFVHDLHQGRVDPQVAGFHLPSSPASVYIDHALEQIASSRDVAQTLESIEPKLLPYQRLKQALAAYRLFALLADGEPLPALPARSVAVGDEYAGSPQLRRWLLASGDLISAPEASRLQSRTIDEDVATAIAAFQHRHGLESDGVLGPRTLRELNVPLEQRITQIELSMERWRWLSALSHAAIVVNIPQFVLFSLPAADDPAAEQIEMNVVVGRTQQLSQTPIFASAITEVVFQPYWEVPSGILQRELMPGIRKDRTYLDRHDMEIVSGEGQDAVVQAPSSRNIAALAAGKLRLRQRPGPKNPLGPVKFVMPNEFSVYLHGTSDEELFDQSQRTYSHGCIRVSDPTALAAFVMRRGRQTWDEAAIESALCGSRTIHVSLPQPVPVVVFYATAVATAWEGVLFFPDVYGHDEMLRSLINQHRKTREAARQ